MINLEKLNKIATPDSSWIQETGERIKNRDWLDKSAKIALKVLRALKDKSMKQTDLAEVLNVTPQQISKIVKGQENFTLETICKIEKALDIEILHAKTENTPYNKYLIPTINLTETELGTHIV